MISDPWLIRISSEDASEDRDHYYIKLLHLILDKTVPTYGAYRVVTAENFNRLRTFLEVYDHRLDVTWSVSTDLREKILLPIRREMVRGLHGYRLFLIRKGDQARFSAVKNLDGLSLGQSDDGVAPVSIRRRGLKQQTNLQNCCRS